MALTRAMLKGMGLTEEQISAIIDEHVSVTQGLKEQINLYKESAELLPEVQAELSTLKSGKDWKSEYDKEHEAFEAFKSSVAVEKETNQKKALYRQLLLNNKIGEKHIDSILRVTDFSKIKLKGENLADVESLTENIKTEWSGFVVSSGEKGAPVETPPTDGAPMTKDAYSKLSLSEQMRYANEHPAEVSAFYG